MFIHYSEWSPLQDIQMRKKTTVVRNHKKKNNNKTDITVTPFYSKLTNYFVKKKELGLQAQFKKNLFDFY